MSKIATWNVFSLVLFLDVILVLQGFDLVKFLRINSCPVKRVQCDGFGAAESKT